MPITTEALLNDLFTTYSNSEIQEGMDRLMCALAESQEFGDEDGIGRSNAIYFIQNLKRHFNRANIINERMKGGTNAPY